MERLKFKLDKELVSDIVLAIEQHNENFIIDVLSDLHAYDIAALFSEIDFDNALKIYKYLDREKASDVLIELDEDIRIQFLETLSAKEIAEQFIENLESDDAVDILANIDEQKKSEIISHIEDTELAEHIVDLLNFKEGTAGAIMGKELVKVDEEWPVVRCVREMRHQAEQLDSVYAVYVVDKENKLLGTLQLKKLLTARAKSKIGDLYNPNVHYVKTSTPSEDVANIMEKYDLVVLPVVDDLNRLVGRITIDDVVDVIKEEAERDYNLASGLSDSVESTSSIRDITRARLPWLLIALVGGLMGARVIGYFEGDLNKIPTLAFFIPLIAAMAGNVGVQSAAIVVQGLANKTLGFSSMGQKLLKELGVGMLNGLVLSILIFIIGYFLYGDLRLSLTISLSLLTVIIFAAIYGTVIPLLLDKYNIDPAIATGPFITTSNDIIGLFIYFSISRFFYA